MLIVLGELTALTVTAWVVGTSSTDFEMALMCHARFTSSTLWGRRYTMVDWTAWTDYLFVLALYA
jgi:hypothetical protein